jgi:hypothetical protein
VIIYFEGLFTFAHRAVPGVQESPETGNVIGVAVRQKNALNRVDLVGQKGADALSAIEHNPIGRVVEPRGIHGL